MTPAEHLEQSNYALEHLQTVHYWLAHYRVPFEAQQIITELAHPHDSITTCGAPNLDPAAGYSLFDELIRILPPSLCPSEDQTRAIRATLLEGHHLAEDIDLDIPDFEHGFGWGLVGLAHDVRIRSRRFLILGCPIELDADVIDLPDLVWARRGRIQVFDSSVFSDHISSENRLAVLDLMSSTLRCFQGEGTWRDYECCNDHMIEFENIAEVQLHPAFASAVEAYPKIVSAVLGAQDVGVQAS
jgi:hypothetical protein